MPYSRPYASGFQDFPSTTTPINATALNTMDVGIKTANDQFQTVTTAQRTALTPTVGQAVWDSDLNQLMVYMNADGGNAWQPVGNVVVCTSTTRPSTPFEGQLIYETNTQRVITYDGSGWKSIFDTDVWSVNDLYITGNSEVAGNGPYVQVQQFYDDIYSGTFIFTKSRGTKTAPTAISANDCLGQILFYGRDNVGEARLSSFIQSLADGNFSSTSAPSRLSFFTTASGSLSNTERLRIANNGFVTLQSGSLGRAAPVTKTGNFTVGTAENWLICNGTGSITVTLPTASSWAGREIMIKTIAAQTVVSNASNVVPLAGGAAGTAILAATAGRWATLVSDGTNWIIMAAN